MIKKLFLLPVMALSLLFITSCSDDAEQDLPQDDQTEMDGSSNILVVYFSQSGTTRGVANRIVELTGANVYRIQAADPYEGNGYPDSDRIQDESYNDRRPGVANLPANLDDYDTIIVGTPIWWHNPAMIVCTFLESYDLTGKTVVPFCTYDATTWRDQTLAKMVEVTPDANHLEGFGTSGSINGVEAWLRSIGVID